MDIDMKAVKYNRKFKYVVGEFYWSQCMLVHCFRCSLKIHCGFVSPVSICIFLLLLSCC